MEIVALKHVVNDDVNQLIAKFVGIKPHKFTEEIKKLMETYQKFLYGYKVDEDYVIEHSKHIGHLLFHKRELRGKNCVRCFKKKVQLNSMCYKCDRIVFDEIHDRRKNYAFGDGCD
jgi:hypothetical protein